MHNSSAVIAIALLLAGCTTPQERFVVVVYRRASQTPEPAEALEALHRTKQGPEPVRATRRVPFRALQDQGQEPALVQVQVPHPNRFCLSPVPVSQEHDFVCDLDLSGVREAQRLLDAAFAASSARPVTLTTPIPTIEPRSGITTSELLFWTAREAFRRFDYKQCLEWCEGVSPKSSLRRAEMIFYAGACHYMLGDRKTAESLFRDARDVCPHFAPDPMIFKPAIINCFLGAQQ